MQDVRQQSLSRRQAEIANLIVAGKSSREIAETLSLSPRTVEHHLEAIFNLGGQSKPTAQGQLKIDQWSVGSFKTDQ